MFIDRNCFKVINEAGIILSLGGDDNCRGDGVRNRLSVIFHFADKDGQAGKAFTPEHLSKEEATEYKESGAISVWAMPAKYASLLNRHLNKNDKD
ncbi:hypothetical protein ACFLQL_02335 [Verrucomicrobiota bacterium]